LIPIEAGLRDRVRDFIQTMIERELEAVLSRPRYARRPKADPENNGGRGVTGHRHGHRSRSLLDPSTLVPQVSAALPLVIKFARDSPLEGDGFELSVPRQRRHPSATANRLSKHHFP
jgi:hypothetical protein